MRYEILLTNSVNSENQGNQSTYVWIENGRWTQGSLGRAVRIGSVGEGTVNVVPQHLQLMEGPRPIVDLETSRPALILDESGGGVYQGPASVLNGDLQWRVVGVR